eukprot:TRINITY_DN6805_c1_g1_i2.p2 TRINITY_DN6805_c1_g1~~TRINITY_DN6805_c1_g1_i2.p2  ORF type:complete len:213 (+),score=64.83 TRINITY_DN6805_c1_g1_i2:138-776(+)
MNIIILGAERAGKTALLRSIKSTPVATSRSLSMKLKGSLGLSKSSSNMRSLLSMTGSGASTSSSDILAMLAANTYTPTEGVELDTWAPPQDTIDSELTFVAPTASPTQTDQGEESEPRGMLFNMWDMAGHEVYQSTHPFFLSRRSVFVLAFHMARIDEELPGLVQWLNCIQVMAADAPLVIVGTHLDEFTRKERISAVKRAVNRNILTCTPT